MQDLISVIIPTYNRYSHLISAIDSVKEQTYSNVEIIVINDGSTQKEYQNFESNVSGVKYINLNPGSKKKLKYSCGAYPRNEGLKIAQGEYIAFLDDDDTWLPNKLEIQIKEMKKNNSIISGTEGYYGEEKYNPKHKYQLYFAQHYSNNLKEHPELKNGIPTFPSHQALTKYNYMVTSSTMIHRKVISELGIMKLIPNGGKNGEWQDWEYWKRITQKYQCLYINVPLFYHYQHSRKKILL